jgi:hypothetical protein
VLANKANHTKILSQVDYAVDRLIRHAIKSMERRCNHTHVGKEEEKQEGRDMTTLKPRSQALDKRYIGSTLLMISGSIFQ